MGAHRAVALEVGRLEELGRGDAAPGAGDDVEAAHRRRVRELSPAPLAEGRPALDEQGHVGAEPGADRKQILLGKAGIPKRVQLNKRGRGVARAPAEPAALGQDLAHGDVGAFRAARGLTQRHRGLVDEVLLHGKVEACKRELPIIAHRKFHAVAVVEHGVEGLQSAVAVLVAPRDVEELVDLAWTQDAGSAHASWRPCPA